MMLRNYTVILFHTSESAVTSTFKHNRKEDVKRLWLIQAGQLIAREWDLFDIYNFESSIL